MLAAAPLSSPLRTALSRRDRAVLARAAALLGRAPEDFADALRALHEAVASSIPNGRIYVLARGPTLVLGSVISGVGIAEGPGGVVVERVDARGARSILGPLRGGW